jgi:gamma-glutamyltranspeptidase / glutathione hydrolase
MFHARKTAIGLRHRFSLGGNWRRQLSVLLLGLSLAACGEQARQGTPGFVEGFAGIVVADEPTAALLGQDVLSAGGSAGDAAATVFFALTVTKPAAAGLMSSGLCVAFDPSQDLHLSYKFVAPSAPRGIAALHARFGQLPWQRAVGPAESLARFGTQLSRAFVEDWRAVDHHSSDAIRTFGERPAIGQLVQNLPLAGLLSQIRQNGAGAFYTGQAATVFREALEQTGMTVDPALWRNAIPEVADSTRLELGNHQIAFAPFPDTPGAADAALWPELDDKGPQALSGLLASAGITAPETAVEETAFVAVDRFGAAVACSLTMGQPFGTGEMAGGSFSAHPAMPSTGPVIVANKPTATFRAAIAGSGAPGLPAALAIDAVEPEASLGELEMQPRTLPRRGGGLITESGGTATGGPTYQTQALGRTNIAACPAGLPTYPRSCSAVADPRGAGYAAIADEPR